jgi:hypothetical protein
MPVRFVAAGADRRPLPGRGQTDGERHGVVLSIRRLVRVAEEPIELGQLETPIQGRRQRALGQVTAALGFPEQQVGAGVVAEDGALRSREQSNRGP